MNTLKKEDFYTIDYIYELPDGERAELIDGQIFNMAPPNRRHQEMVGELHYRIREYIDKNNGDCKVYPAPFAVFINKDEYNYVEPDISVICDKNKLDDRGCNGAPDWIIEVVSPSSRRMDYAVKLFKYKNSGVREYWIADPQKNRISVYFFEGESMEEYTFSDTVKVNIYNDLEINFSKISMD